MFECAMQLLFIFFSAKSFVFPLNFPVCCWRPKHFIGVVGTVAFSMFFYSFSRENSVVFRSFLTTNWEFNSKPSFLCAFSLLAWTNFLDKYFMLFENQSRSIKLNDLLWELILDSGRLWKLSKYFYLLYCFVFFNKYLEKYFLGRIVLWPFFTASFVALLIGICI